MNKIIARIVLITIIMVEIFFLMNSCDCKSKKSYNYVYNWEIDVKYKSGDVEIIRYDLTLTEDRKMVIKLFSNGTLYASDSYGYEYVIANDVRRFILLKSSVNKNKK